MTELTKLPLPRGVRSLMIDDVNGLHMHVLVAGEPGQKLLLLLHGFPELAYSWRKIMPALADAGYYVVAPDQRGYGRTTGWQKGFDAPLRPFALLNIVRDAIALIARLGYPQTAAIIGHDFGSFIAAWSALIRPDIFPAVTLMSAPFGGAPSFADPLASFNIHADLLALTPPRKHYQWYYSTADAEADMLQAPQGLFDFMRAYYHVKSAQWPGNQPFALADWTAAELAKMPTYYIMNAEQGMAASVAPYMPSGTCSWLCDEELGFYVGEFTRTGLQGGLNWYRCATSTWQADELKLFGNRRIEVPSAFISGTADWGVYQRPGHAEAMQDVTCADMQFFRLIDGAGHWVQQEQPEAVIEAMLTFLGRL